MLKQFALFAIAAFAAAPACAAEAKWEDQLREMCYLMVQISSINAINGLNLTRDQTTKLRALTNKVEAAGAQAPKPVGTFCPRLEEVRQTYYELRELLVQGKPVPPALERRVARARATESQVIRETMTTQPAANERLGRCTSCHARPRHDALLTDAADDRLARIKHQQKRRADFAHMIGLYSLRGLREVGCAMPQVDAILTDAQKEIMHKFACCLTPPSELSDPVRAGQAEVSERAMKIVRTARDTKPQAWPIVKGIMLARLLQTLQMKKPDTTAQDKQQARQRIGALLDKARALPEVEFEMEKENLCRELTFDANRENRSDRARKFTAAYFLLLPGIGDMYAEILSRLDKQAN